MDKFTPRTRFIVEAAKRKYLEESSDSESVTGNDEYIPSSDEDIRVNSSSDDSLQDGQLLRGATSDTTDGELSESENVQLNRPVPSSPNASSDFWTEPVKNHPNFQFTAQSGLSAVVADMSNPSPFGIFSNIIDNEILEMIVEQTNIYANQVKGLTTSRKSRVVDWKPTTLHEIKKLFGILIYMGVVKMPKLSDYWSKNFIYRNDVAPSHMSRNRFELLLRMLHFSNNEENSNKDRLHKIQPLLDKIICNYQELYTPGEILCVDESIIPFQGRLALKQYIPQKRHKYGVKIFKLCSGKGYVWNMKIYAGRERDARRSVPTAVVMQLSEKLLDAGRTIVTDNYYTSLELANSLLDRRTHLLGTLRKNRRGIPKDVTAKKLKKGEIVVKENQRGVSIMKWKDKRDVLLLSTCHSNEMEEVEKYRSRVLKPVAILKYNEGKSSIDLSDQLSSYSTPLRRSLKWYRKVALELLLGTSVVNAYFIFNQICGSKMQIVKFRENLIGSLLGNESQGDRSPTSLTLPQTSRKRMATHSFKKEEGGARINRKYCRGCYEKKQLGEIEKNKVKKVTTYCDDCPKKPRFCLDCFHKHHL
ncbi:piggyBac transposable element-derived protein 3-like [Ischnura elegans]|uniref:piggyBac transposable element-derived protein 3-like n=2 Tax=Ischnura elegans TaxID=197161 RepID=UPI001ED86B98|nr:piggyBac transposable element-derived protein 3-like [Ischnura elegans]XP_046398726.1 piggyBac transposable element-derived protein 3-like [Ischnura elegans]